VFLSFGVFLIY
jgi:hypothetical protein